MSNSHSPSPLPSQWIDETDPSQPILVTPARPNRWSHLLSGAAGLLFGIAVYNQIAARQPAPPVLITNPSPATSAQPKPHRLQVHVVGCVQQPGVYTFPADARIYDAVQKAKPRREANLEAINLAAYLEDGKQIVVPAQGTPVAQTTVARNSSTSPPAVENISRSSPARRRGKPVQSAPEPVSTPGRAARSKSTLAPQSVDLNSASAEELETLPGVGPALAQRIIEYREGHNGFGTVDELDDVKGIGEKKLEKIRPYVTAR